MNTLVLWAWVETSAGLYGCYSPLFIITYSPTEIYIKFSLAIQCVSRWNCHQLSPFISSANCRTGRIQCQCSLVALSREQGFYGYSGWNLINVPSDASKIGLPHCSWMNSGNRYRPPIFPTSVMLRGSWRPKRPVSKHIQAFFTPFMNPMWEFTIYLHADPMSRAIQRTWGPVMIHIACWRCRGGHGWTGARYTHRPPLGR